MSKLEIRGVIVPSDYDCDWCREFIEKGLITPESTFRTALAKADRGEPLNIHVNSPGGSVFAGNEMINAVLTWKVENKQPVNVTVGAMAASMGAAFTISVADTVTAHANAKMMFHGAWGGAVGGSEAMADTSDLLDKINMDIKTILLSRYNLTPETVDEWFAEGREGWLTADDMIDAGIATEVIGSDDQVIDFVNDDLLNMSTHGLDIAAYLPKQEATNASDPNPAPANAGEPPVEPVAVVEPAEPAEPEPTPDPAAINGPAEPDPSDALRAIITAELNEEFSAAVGVLEETISTLNGKLDARDDLLAKMQSERDKLKAENDQLTISLDKVNGKFTKLLTGSVTFESGGKTWPEAVAECGGDYQKAAKLYPDERLAYNQLHNKRTK
jgi:ATP-dependent Clp protease protease subunit